MLNKLPIGLASGGVLVVILSIILGWVIVPNVIKNQVKEKIQLVNGTEAFDRWSSPKHDVRLNFYIWNGKIHGYHPYSKILKVYFINLNLVTNAHEFTPTNLPTPILQEIGPFVYQEDRKKRDIVWNEDKTLINYTEPIFYHFNRELSCCDEDTKVNIVNVAYFTIMTVINNLIPCPFGPSPLLCIPNMISESLIVGEPFVRNDISVGDLIFYGYDVSKITKNLPAAILPEEFADDKFAIYRTRNGSFTGKFEVQTGKGDHETFGYIKSWRNETTLTEFWYGDECKMINGTDGSINPPFVKKDQVLPVYNVDLCRSLYLHFHKEVVTEDIDAYRFVTPLEMLETGYDLETGKITDNYCFCKTWNTTPSECPRNGALDVGTCQSGAPLIMTNPHFLNSDSNYSSEYSQSMSPNFDKHNTYIDVEPNSGLLLSVGKRIQVNIETKAFKNIYKFQKIPYRLFPLLHADESVKVDPDTLDYVRNSLLKPIKIINVVKWVLIALGIVISASGAFVYYRRRKASK